MSGYLFGLMALAAFIVAFMGTGRAKATAGSASGIKVHSRPIYHGLNAA
ncbi:MAG: phosphate ABC transporter permease family protein, partial [Paracoccaceae bacterium]